MTVRVNHSVTATLSNSATLADLEELLAAAKAAGLPRTAGLRIEKYAGDQREPSYSTITVSAR